MRKRIFSFAFFLMLSGAPALAHGAMIPWTPEAQARRDLSQILSRQIFKQKLLDRSKWKPRWRPLAQEAVLRYESKLSPQVVYQYKDQGLALLLTYQF